MFYPTLYIFKGNSLLTKLGIEPLSSDKWIIALENMAIKVGNKRIPTNVPKVEALISILYWLSTNSKVFSVGAVSIRLPVKGCCIILASLEIITIKLNRDRAEAINLTLAPDNLTA